MSVRTSPPIMRLLPATPFLFLRRGTEDSTLVTRLTLLPMKARPSLRDEHFDGVRHLSVKVSVHGDDGAVPLFGIGTNGWRLSCVIYEQDLPIVVASGPRGVNIARAGGARSSTSTRSCGVP